MCDKISYIVYRLQFFVHRPPVYRPASYRPESTVWVLAHGVKARFDRYNISWPNKVVTPRKVGQSRQLSNRIRFENNCKNRGDAHAHMTLFKMAAKMHTTSKHLAKKVTSEYHRIRKYYRRLKIMNCVLLKSNAVSSIVLSNWGYCKVTGESLGRIESYVCHPSHVNSSKNSLTRHFRIRRIT